jgi:Mrp family chromosome partitioning ATPase
VDADSSGLRVGEALRLEKVALFTSAELKRSKIDPRSLIHGSPLGIDILTIDDRLLRRLDYCRGWDGLFDVIRSRYTTIIVDAGPLSSPSLAVWNKRSDGLLLVVDSMRTTVQSLARLRKEIEAAGITLSGIVMNKRSFPIPQVFYSWIY